MRQIKKEVLRLKFELELGRWQSARSCGINHGTVGDYIRRAEATGWRRVSTADAAGAELGGNPRRIAP